MTANRSCARCGAPIPDGDRFCQMCGMAAPPPTAPGPAIEAVVGHLPAEVVEEGKGVFGGARRRQVNLVITTGRLLCLQETEDTNSAWLAESERLEEEAARTGIPWRALIDRYPWNGPLWAEFFRNPPDALLAADSRNWAVPLRAIVEASVTLDPERDRLDLLMDNGQVLSFGLFNLVGAAAARFLAQALGAARVRMGPAQRP